MSQSGILNRGVYPPGTVVETIQGYNGNMPVNPPVSPDVSNNIILKSTNNNLTFANGAGNILEMTVSTSPFVSYVNVVGPITYNASTTTEFISCDTSGGAITVILPNNAAQGETFIIKDRTGNAETNNITIQVDGFVLNAFGIDKAALQTINTENGSFRVLCNAAVAAPPAIVTLYEVF